jgi:PhnB protein
MKKASKPIPDGMSMLTPHLWFNGNCAQAIDFYKNVFGAEEFVPSIKGPDGKSIMHAMLKFGDSNIMMADAWPGTWEKGPVDGATTGFFLYVEDCDALYNKAVDEGCEVVNEMMDAFWGDRMGTVKDPFGHCWSIATYKWEMTMEEIQKGQDEWAKTI